MENQSKETPPQIFKSWKQLYAIILSIHAVILFLFWVFTKTYQ